MEWRRYGLPPGSRFVPKDCELISILLKKQRGEPLPVPPDVFHHVDVLAVHPQQLYDDFMEYMEDGYIYFFSERKFSNPDGKRERPIRAMKHGAWKASGGAKKINISDASINALTRTLVFYNDKVDGERIMKAAERTDYAMNEFMIRDPKTGKIIDLALYRLYMKERNQRKKLCWVDDDDVAAADAAVHNDDDQGQLSALPAPPPPQPEMAPAAENEPADMDDAFTQCHEGTGYSKPEMENEPAASQLEMENFSQYYYGPSCSQPEMAQLYYNSYAHVAVAPAAAVNPSFLLPVNQHPDEGMYLDGAAYVGSYSGLVNATPYEMTMMPWATGPPSDLMPPDSAAQLQQMTTPTSVGQMCGTELTPWAPEQPWALQDCGAGANVEDETPPPAKPCAAEHRQKGVGSDCAENAARCETGVDLEMDGVIGDSSDKKISWTEDFLRDGEPSCREDLEFCAQFMDE